MKQRKTTTILALCLAATSLMLSGCGTSSSSAGTDNWPSSHDSGSTRMSMTIANSSIPSGSTFFEGAKPTVTYHVDGQTDQNATNWSNKTKYSIYATSDEEKANPYGAGDALPAGEYIAFARYESKNKQDWARFTVTDTAPETGSEGHGYATTSSKALEPYMLDKHAKMGALGVGKFPSLGTPKLIVVPVAFSNVSFKQAGSTTLAEDEAAAREIIRKAFFGGESETEWESLKSYYKKSSYGKLDIQGEVSPIYTYSMTTDAFEENGEAADIVKSASNWLKNSQGYNLDDYDMDDDGFIDGIELVYVTDKAPNSKDLWWNFTSVTSNEAGTKANPAPKRYFWSLFNYIKTGYYKTIDIDAHTLVHETGHLMGLNDYYSYDKTEGPAGCSDMMDMNVGDHNAYSKMCYAWTGPKVIDGSSKNFTVTLDSFTDTGDFILLRNTTTDKWNGMPYDEYLVLQYYTPTGVNEVDSKGYPEWSGQTSSSGSSAMGHGGTYEHAGLQVYHVDARIAATVTDGKTSKPQYTDKLLDSEETVDGITTSASFFPHDNTPSRSKNVEDGTLNGGGAYREIHAILSSGVNGLDGSTYYNSFGQTTNLFGLKDTKDEAGKALYGGDTYSNWKMRAFYPNDMQFDDYSTLNWTFSVSAQTDSAITLHFLENA